MSEFHSETVEFMGKTHTIFGLHKDDFFMTRYRRKKTLYEAPHLKYLIGKQLEGTYVDVGANIGQHMIIFSEHCPSTMIVAFEPVPELFSVLEYNAERMSTPSRLHQQAAWKNDGLVALSEFNPSGPTMGGTEVVDGAGEVESVALDTYFKYWRGDPIVFIKIDVEGREPEVIQGAKKTIKKHKPLILVEEGNDLDRKNRLRGYMDEIMYVRVHKVGGGSCPTHFWGPRA